MITFREAKQIAETEINRHQEVDDDLFILIDNQIVETEYAWIFPYTSKKYWETGDLKYAVAGNAPLFISKLDGQISKYRTGLSKKGIIDEHEEKNKLWTLTLDDYSADAKGLLELKHVLGWTQTQLSAFKQDPKKPIEYGSETRLANVQSLLASNGIKSNLQLSMPKQS